MDASLAMLEEQHAELAGLLAGLSPEDWHAPTRCDGWDVADVVLHLAQTDELAVASASGRFADAITDLTGGLGATSVDEGADRMVARQRGLPPQAIAERWSAGAARLIDVLSVTDPSARVPWVAGDISARTLGTTRLAETWIHTGDVAEAVGTSLPAGDRLWPIARLAWRTLPYAFASAGRTMSGPIAFRLRSPAGAPWDFLPDEAAVTTITGPAAELCAVAARRIDGATTSLVADGPDGAAVLALVRTYA